MSRPFPKDINDKSSSSSWWQTLPGVLAAIAATIGAIAGLVTALHQANLLQKGETPTANKSLQSELSDPSLPAQTNPNNPPKSPPPRPDNPSRLGVINVSPWKYFPEPGYSVQNFTQNSNSFDFTVNNTRGAGVIPYGIQIISSNPVPLEQGKRYRMRFQISASESFELVTRLGEHNYQNSIFINEVFNVGQPEETFELVFTAEQYTRSSALYFQFGNAPTGTRVKVSDIQIEPLP